MKLFTKEIDTKLFEQYLTGSDLENQMVVAKIFNPYGRGTWYLLNSDPEDPEYLWAIVDLEDIEVGSVNRSDLENIRIKPFMLGLERDLSFTPMNAAEIYRGLSSGKQYATGGEVEEINQVKIEIKTQYYDEKDNRKNVALKYDVNYIVTFNNKDFIELTGTLKPYHTGRDYDYEFEVDYFADQKEEDYYEKNSEKIQNEILDKFYSKKATGGAIYKHKHMDATAKILEKTNKGYKVEFTDNSMKKPKTKIMYFNDIDFDKDKGYFEKMETGGGVKISRSQKQYNKEVDAYKWFVIDLGNKKSVSGWEYKEDANDALFDYDGDKNYKVIAESSLKKLGIENPKDRWKTKLANGGGVGDFKKGDKVTDGRGNVGIIKEIQSNGNLYIQWISYSGEPTTDITADNNPNDFEKLEYATGGGVEKSVLHLYKLIYPNGQYIVEDYNGGSMTPKEALKKMRISLRGFKSYKYASASSDSDNYKKWHTKKSIGYSNTEAWDEVFGKEKYEKGGKFVGKLTGWKHRKK